MFHPFLPNNALIWTATRLFRYSGSLTVQHVLANLAPVTGVRGVVYNPIVGTNALLWTPNRVYHHAGGTVVREVKVGAASIPRVQGIVRHPFLNGVALISTPGRLYRTTGTLTATEVKAGGTASIVTYVPTQVSRVQVCVHHDGRRNVRPSGAGMVGAPATTPVAYAGSAPAAAFVPFSSSPAAHSTVLGASPYPNSSMISGPGPATGLVAGNAMRLFAFAATKKGECFYVPDDKAGVGTCNVIPFGTTKQSTTWRNQKYQTIVLKPQLRSAAGSICEIGFTPCGTELREFDSLVVEMNHTGLAGFTGNLGFAANLGANALTVLDAKSYVWHNTADKWNRIGLQKPFPYDPSKGNLLIQIEVRGAHMVGGPGFRRSKVTEFPDRLFAFNWTTSPPASGQIDRAGLKIEVCYAAADLALFGKSCGTAKHALAGSAKPGQVVSFQVTGAPVSSLFAILALGSSNGAPLPIPFPGTQCKLYQTVDIGLLVAPVQSGGAKINLPMPNAPCLRFYSQYFLVQGLQIQATNYGRVLIGN